MPDLCYFGYMAEKPKKSKLIDNIIIIVAVILVGQAIWYALYSRREYLIYLASSDSNINFLSQEQMFSELNNTCLAKLNKEEKQEFIEILANADDSTLKTKLEACRTIMRKTKTNYTISMPANKED